LPDPVPLIATLHDLMEDAPIAIVTTPERDLVRGFQDLGPPGNPHHVREWSLREFETLLRSAGLNIAFIGLTANNDRDWAKRTILAVLSRNGIQVRQSAPSAFRVIAFICAFNEEDIIEASLKHLVDQGIEVYLIDNWSTDRTVERAEAFLGRGLNKITKFPIDSPSSTYDWHALLSHVEELSNGSDADWCIHCDADEFRESPWPQLRLRESFYRVDQEGFNAVDHTCIVFHPTDMVPTFDGNPQGFSWFEFGRRAGHFQQVKAWKKQKDRVRLADSGGHSVDFPGRKIYPFKFLLRHYPIRSQEHGVRKILSERQPRWNPAERNVRGWHVQYDHVTGGHQFLARTSDLIQYRSDNFCRDYLVERLSGIGAERRPPQES
jgi:glycosyltransferase involved in cell wall biosynthesis